MLNKNYKNEPFCNFQIALKREKFSFTACFKYALEYFFVTNYRNHASINRGY